MAKDKKDEELMPLGENLPARPEDFGRDYIPEEELPMPRLRIIQKETDDQVAGVFVNTQTEETFAAVECILLDVIRRRTYWDPTLKNMDEPLCRSRDAITGEGDPGGSCTKCLKAPWTGPNQEVKPECALVYEFIGLDESGAPFLFSVQRTGVKPARNFIAAAQRRGKKPLYYTGCVLSLRKVDRPATYYVPVFKRVGETPIEQWGELEGVLAKIRTALERAPVETADDAPSEF